MKIEDEIQQKKFASAHQKAAVNLIYTFSWLTNRQNEFMKEFDLSMQQFNILRILRGRKSEPASILTIKERMLDKNSDVSRIIDRMVKKELVDRQICPNDRRQMDVTITAKGLTILADIDKRDAEFHSVMSGLSEHEAEQLSSLLDKLRSAE